MVESVVSYRQVGKEFPGKLFRGRSPEPSDYDSITPAFGTKSARFIAPSHRPPSAPRAITPIHGHTVLGCMGKSQRFKPRQYASITPGPGSYNWKIGESVKLIKTAFMSKESRSASPVCVSPAPGHYDPHTVPGTRSTSSMFRSTVKRLATILQPVAPPPGTYSPKYAAVSKTPAVTSSFKQSVAKRRIQINLYNPLSKPSEDPSPGPGAYELPRARAAFNPLPSAVFLSAENRFPTPQPVSACTYDVLPKTVQRQAVAMAAFKSDTSRELPVSEAEPGPTSYRPSPLPKHQSFHLNLSKRWVK